MKRIALILTSFLLLFSACSEQPGALLDKKKLVFLDEVFTFSGGRGNTYVFSASSGKQLQFLLSRAGDFNRFSIMSGKWSYGVSVSKTNMHIAFPGEKSYTWNLSGKPGGHGLGYSSYDVEKSVHDALPDFPDIMKEFIKKEEVPHHDDPAHVAALGISFHNAAYSQTAPFYSPGSVSVRFLVFLGGLLLFFLGRYFARNPEDSWYLSEGWKFCNSEPSDLWLTGNSISGYFIMIIGGLAAVLAWIIPG